MRSLIKIDHSRIFLARRIRCLGFASHDALAQHYSSYGTVERVLVTHSYVKSTAFAAQAGSSPLHRLRPSGLGFIVMSTPVEVEAILASGPEQLVHGAMILVQPFERSMSEQIEAILALDPKQLVHGTMIRKQTRERRMLDMEEGDGNQSEVLMPDTNEFTNSSEEAKRLLGNLRPAKLLSPSKGSKGILAAR